MSTVQGLGKSVVEVVIVHTDSAAGVVTGHGVRKEDVSTLFLYVLSTARMPRKK